MEAGPRAAILEEKVDFGNTAAPEEKEVSQETCIHAGTDMEVAAVADETTSTTTGEQCDGEVLTEYPTIDRFCFGTVCR